jgi:hypothetical protein
MSRRSSGRITRFRTFTRYAPATVRFPRAASSWALLFPAGLSRWAMLLAFVTSPSTAHAFVSWISR